MTTEEPSATPSSPYRGIHPFRYVDQQFFIGREKTVEALLAKVLIYRVVLLFGESGTGKSSVINAGLIPKLEEKGFYAERLRVRPFADKPIFIERISTGQQEAGPFLPSLFSQNRPGESTVEPPSLSYRLDTFQTIIHEKAERANPVLFFDQFEELFTLFSEKSGEPSSEKMGLQSRIIDAIFDIMNNQTLKAKVVIIIREDFLGKLEVFSKKYPQIFDNYVRLGFLDRENAKRAILGPFERESLFSSRVTSPLAERIVQELSERGTDIEIHPTQLQIICAQLWDSYSSRVSEIALNQYEELGGVKGILEGYLKTELDRIDPVLRTLAVNILGSLITDSDTRDIVSSDKIKSLVANKMPGSDTGIEEALKNLEKRRVINQTSQRDSLYYEVSSEYLIAPIKEEVKIQNEEKDRRETEERARITYVKRRRWIVWGALGGILVAILASSYLYIQLEAEKQIKQKEIKLALERKSVEAAKSEAERAKALEEANLQLKEGKIELRKKNYDLALQSLNNARETYEDYKISGKVSETLIEMGRVYTFKGDFSTARKVFSEARDVVKGIEDHIAIGRALESLAKLAEREEKMEKAINLYGQASRAYQDGEDNQSEGRVLERMAVYEDEKENFAEAAKIYKRTFENYRVAGDLAGAARSQKALKSLAPFYSVWGYLLDLHSQQIYNLHGAEVTLGGNWGSVKNDIGFSDRVVSRRHLSIRRDLIVEDLRSLNGTSINGEFLPYGVPRKLADRDYLVPAYYRAMQFRISPPQILDVPKGTWAILLNPSSQTHHYLYKDQYSLVISADRLVLEEGESSGAVMRVKINSETGKMEILDIQDNWIIRYFYKADDYDYKSGLLSQSNTWIPAMFLPIKYQEYNEGRVKKVQDGPSFQFVKF